MAIRRFTPHPLVLRRLTVVRVVDITPRMRRVTLGGAQVGGFERDGLRHPPFASPMFDDHVKLLFSTDGPVEAVLPKQLAHGIEWPIAAAREGRDYTPRRVGDGEIDLDFVVHSGPVEAGPAEAWAGAAKPGDVLWTVGPKSSTVLPDDIDRLILIGDETALPAIGRCFEERPVSAPVHAVITVADESARQELALRPEDRITWVVAEPGDARALARAVVESGAMDSATHPYVWAAAESQALLPLRRALTREHGIPRSHLDITGYWHARVPARDPSDPKAAPSEKRVAGAAAPADSPVAWFAVRAALQLHLFEALEPRPLPASSLATRIGLKRAELDPLVAVLADRAYLVVEGQRLRISGRGMQLLSDDHAREAFDGFEASQILALQNLPEALRDGGTAWERTNGASVIAQAATDAELHDELLERAEGLAYLMPALLAARPWGEKAAVAVRGPGAAVVGDALRKGGEGSACRVVEQGADTEVHAHALAHLTDAEARAYLSGEIPVASMLLIESTRADALDPRTSEHELLRLATTGAPTRSAERLIELAAECGWTATGTTELGWGVSCLAFTAGPGASSARIPRGS